MYNLYRFEVSIALSTLTLLGNQSCRTEALYPLNSDSPVPFTPPLATTALFPVSVSVTTPEPSCDGITQHLSLCD